ncbi:MAG: arylsulfotransferase family protein [Thermoleophilaceae bacterium]
MASALSALRTAALAALLAAACAGTAEAATPVVRSDPQLFPDFRSSQPDYTVLCQAGQPVELKVRPRAGTRVSVAGGSAHRGRFKRNVTLSPGRALQIDIRSGGKRRAYHVRCVPPDFPHWRVKRESKPQVAWYLLTPSEFDTTKPGYVVLFDSRGVPVWWRTDTPPPFDAHLLPDGNLAWTHIAINNPASGPAEERSFDGRLVRTFSTHGTAANEHDLQVQPDGSAYMIAYTPRDHVDLSRWDGPSDATVLDGDVQQIGPSGELLWHWNTGQHLPLSASGRWLHRLIFDTHPLPLPDGREAYDIAHLNSIEPYGGRLLLSNRYNDAVYSIDRRSGRIVWKLGGRKTDQSLKLTGDPLHKREFGGQHDARTTDGGRTVTVYDNGTLRGRAPRALEWRIDERARKARLVNSIHYAPADESVCCGGARRLPGGDWVVSWGHTPYVTEQTGSGRLVLEIRFADKVASYRAEPILPGRFDRSKLRRGMDAMAAARG